MAGNVIKVIEPPPSSLNMSDSPETNTRPWAVLLIFLRLGLTSFGGPIAHLGYFRDEFVIRRHWLSERSYADLVALCQFLPGPASSQVGIALGLSRAGYRGALAAWVGFTLPSALALVLVALSLARYAHAIAPGVLQGLQMVAIAVIAQAVWGMARALCPDIPRIIFMAVATCAALLLPSAGGQITVIALAASSGFLLFKPSQGTPHEPLPITIRRRIAMLWLSLFCALLIGLPILAELSVNQALAQFDAFYRVGSMVFGGGHVVLPLLEAEVVASGWVSRDTFLAGYGLVQAVPGPLFTFAAFLGASMNGAPSGWAGGLICLVAIFLPSFLLVVGVLPLWERLRRNTRAQAALMGINAAVVGLLLAALVRPITATAQHAPQDLALALLALVALMLGKLPPWLVVIAGGAAGWLLSFF